jgi:hypothetical protein
MSIHTDDTEVLEFNAEDAFLKMLEPDADKQPSDSEDEPKKKNKEPEPEDDETEETSEETPEDDAEETDEGEETDEEAEDDESDEGEEKDKKATKVVLEADADAVVKAKIDGKDVEIPVKDLTRLYGQEAALTRKSQEAAEARKHTDAQLQRYTAGLDTMLKRAIEAYKPYESINWVALSKDPSISAEEITLLQQQAQGAYDNVRYLQGEVDQTVQAVQQARHHDLMKQAQDSWKVLNDPEKGIKGWSKELYGEIREFAISSGIPKVMMDDLVDPGAFKIIHKAMLYDKGQKAAQTKTVKVDKTPKKIIKGTTEPVTKKSKPNSEASAMKRLRESGDIDDVADVFLARMARE